MLKKDASADLQAENKALAKKYCPLLVLFPEIEPGSKRKEHHHSGICLGSAPPLDQDYHPRDIHMVLDNVYLPSTGVFKARRRASREEVLSAMGDNKVKYISLVGNPPQVEKYWSEYARLCRESGNTYPETAYTRVIRGKDRFEGYISIQYWLAYFFNDCANVHEMDWEMVSVVLKTAGQLEEPVACAYNAHMASFRKPWAKVEKVDENGLKNARGLHPVAYIANGSHASYFSDYPSSFSVAEDFLKPVLQRLTKLNNLSASLGFIDYVPGFEDDNSVKCFPEIQVIPDPDEKGKWSGDWRWLNFQGNWGSLPKLSLRQRIAGKIPFAGQLSNLLGRPLQEAGPTGPNKGHGSCWNRPFEWLNKECIEIDDATDWAWCK